MSLWFAAVGLVKEVWYRCPGRAGTGCAAAGRAGAGPPPSPHDCVPEGRGAPGGVGGTRGTETQWPKT